MLSRRAGRDESRNHEHYKFTVTPATPLDLHSAGEDHGSQEGTLGRRDGDAGRRQSAYKTTGRKDSAGETISQRGQEWKWFTAWAAGVGDNVTFYECVMEFVATNGQTMRLEQVSVTK